MWISGIMYKIVCFWKYECIIDLWSMWTNLKLIVKQVSDRRILGASSLQEKEDEVTTIHRSAPASVATSPAPMFTCDYPECNAVSLKRKLN